MIRLKNIRFKIATFIKQKILIKFVSQNTILKIKRKIQKLLLFL